MRKLNLFILDDMIEQFERHNPVPEYQGKNSTVDDTMEAELLAGYLTELKALRSRCQLYEIKIIHMNQELRHQDDLIIEMKNLIDSKENK